MPTLLTGQLPAAERRKAALRTASGQSLIVVGTHALPERIDQFRRSRARRRGRAAPGSASSSASHCGRRDPRRTRSCSTATPIPRTVAMTVFGDLDVSTIRTMPEARAGIQTFVAPLHERPAWFAPASGTGRRRGREGTPGVRRLRGRSTRIVAEGRHGRRTGGRSAGRHTAHPVGWCRSPTCSPPSASPTSGSRSSRKVPSDEKDAVMQAFGRGDIDVLRGDHGRRGRRRCADASTMAILEAGPVRRLAAAPAPRTRRARRRAGLSPARHRGAAGLRRAPAGGGRRRHPRRIELAEVDLTLRGEGDVLGDAQSARDRRCDSSGGRGRRSSSPRRASPQSIFLRRTLPSPVTRGSPTRSSVASAWRSGRLWRRADAVGR